MHYRDTDIRDLGQTKNPSGHCSPLYLGVAGRLLVAKVGSSVPIPDLRPKQRDGLMEDHSARQHVVIAPDSIAKSSDVGVRMLKLAVSYPVTGVLTRPLPFLTVDQCKQVLIHSVFLGRAHGVRPPL